jgi:hypothetical protein
MAAGAILCASSNPLRVPQRQESRRGMFAMWNPKASCAHAK